MITNSNIGKKHTGQNLGNQLFQIAAMYGMAKRYNTRVILSPDWKYLPSFHLSDEIVLEEKDPELVLKEPFWHYCIDYFDQFKDQIKTTVTFIDAYLQSEKYWDCDGDAIRHLFAFKPELDDRIRLEQKNVISADAVVVSVRRGDFITNPNHFLLPKEYYLQALEQYFPGKDLVIFSDDFKWCKKVFGRLAGRNVYFADSYDAISQLCFMRQFSNFVISNSTFSWWGAYLSNAKDKKVVRPHYIFDGPLRTINIKDHYPQSWIEFKHQPEERNKLSQFLFYNDNNYRIKSWARGVLYTVYSKFFKTNSNQ